MPDLGRQLQRCFRDRVCLMGMGNIDYGDDGFGVVLAEGVSERLRNRGDLKDRHAIINAQTSPERFMGAVSEGGFDHVIFLDAVEFGGAPGTVVFLDRVEMTGRFPQVSTHKMSPALMAEWIEYSGATRAWLLGVQPGSMRPDKGLTREVKGTLEVLEDLICDMWVGGVENDFTAETRRAQRFV